MVVEKEKGLKDFIKFVSPGSPLRTVIDDLARSNLGGLIVFDTPQLHNEKIIEGGFRINCRFTQQKLFELCKMDGALIVSPDLKRILYANVFLTPSTSVFTVETGTRHKAAERTAKQAKTFVIAVSERKNKTTLYHGSSRYYLRGTEEILNALSSTIHMLEKQRELFESHVGDLNILEMSDLVSARDVCKVIQRAEIMLKTADSIKRNFLELGKEGHIMHMRYRELLKGIERQEEAVLKDYSSLSLKKSKTVLSNITFDGLLDLESIARLLIDQSLESSVSPKGYRFLSNVTLSSKETSQMIKHFSDLKNILAATQSDLEAVLKNRASNIFEEINNLREQVLSGKAVL